MLKRKKSIIIGRTLVFLISLVLFMNVEIPSKADKIVEPYDNSISSPTVTDQSSSSNLTKRQDSSDTENNIVVVIGLLAGAVILTILVAILIKVLYGKRENK